MIGFRRLPNLSNNFVHAKVTFPTPDKVRKQGPKVCWRLGKCKYCPLITRSNETPCTFRHITVKGRNLPPRHSFTCEMSNIVYCITCRKCKKQYIGETGRPFRHRIYEHKRSVSNTNDIITPVSKHFGQRNHSVSDMVFNVIEWCGPATGLAQDITASRRQCKIICSQCVQ